MEEWKEYKLGELIELNNGFAFKSKDFVTSGIPVIKIKNVKANRILLEDVSYVSMETAQNIKCTPIMPSDILITMTGNRKDGSIDSWVGKVALFNHEGLYLLNQRVSAIRIKYPDIVDYRYLAYYLSSFASQLYFINHSNSSGGQANISPEIVNNYIVNLPSFQTQKRISDLLKTLDDKIELNRRINGNLEQQVQALFNHYFIERPELLGKYKIGNLTEIANYLNGLAMQKFRPQMKENGIPVLKIKELGQGYTDASSDICSENIADEYKVHNGDVIFSWSGTLMVKIWCGGLCGLNQHLFKVTSEIYPKWFYYFWTKHHLNKFIRIAQDKAVTMGHIKRSDLEASEILIPQMDILAKLDAIINPLFSQKIEMKCENRNLATIRDILLPRLMSGKLKIDDLNR